MFMCMWTVTQVLILRILMKILIYWEKTKLSFKICIINKEQNMFILKFVWIKSHSHYFHIIILTFMFSKFLQKVTLYGSRLWNRMEPRGSKVELAGASKPAIVHKNGIVIFGNDGKMVRNIRKLYFIFVKWMQMMHFHVNFTRKSM